jgi:hypothetical protein
VRKMMRKNTGISATINDGFCDSFIRMGVIQS